MVVGLRNELFALRLLSSQEFNLPVISIGNITTGGTGKTPHTEYLAQLLKPSFKVAVLSRGYKRRTRGFFVVESTSKVRQVGDEPLQIKSKFTDIVVAVDANRVRGIRRLISGPDKPDVILLDDAFQHQYVTPGINILLTDYNRLITHDSLLPYGRLRESASNKSRATIIIVTKCPDEIKPIDARIIIKELNIRPYQSLYFSKINYEKLVPVFPSDIIAPFTGMNDGSSVLMITGISNPSQLRKFLQQSCHNILEMNFPDHHHYTMKDIDRLRAKFDSISATNKLIVTTEKDMVRFRDLTALPAVIRQNLYYIPVRISFLNKSGEEFNRKILSYVKQNKSNFNFYSKSNGI